MIKRTNGNLFARLKLALWNGEINYKMQSIKKAVKAFKKIRLKKKQK
jgi:hypothetical protein